MHAPYTVGAPTLMQKITRVKRFTRTPTGIGAYGAYSNDFYVA